MEGKTERAEFDSYANRYADLLRDPIRDWFAADPAFYAKRKLSLILDFLCRRRVDTRRLQWLDVGCGQGELLRLGQSHFGESAGCDPSTAMLDACTGLSVRRQESATALPFSDRSFDLLTAVCVYHHVAPSVRSAFTREMARILKPGGILCVIEHNPLNPIARLIVSRIPMDAGAALVGARRTKQLLRSAGLMLLETAYFLYLPSRMQSRFPAIENMLARLPLGGQYAVFGSKAI